MDSPTSKDEVLNERWKDVYRLTDRESVFAHPAFEPGRGNFEVIQNTRILVVGAGGLGCEILKDLALSGFKNIEVIDMDTIDLSNLNRQFLFREADIGKSKAETAANFINKRIKEIKVVPHNCRIQDKELNFYRRFHIIICGLDSISARKWLNGTVCSLVQFDDDGEIDTSTIIPLVDGGTEGFKGNARVILPFFSPCIECTLDLYPPQINFPLCTIAHTPRLPEHCIEYTKVILWEKEKPFDEEKIDGDNPEHIQWILEKSVERAKQFNISGVDLRLTQGVVKRIIPAVASTNAVIAGSCALEALKLASNIACPLDNYLNFSNIDGAHFGPVKLERNPNCIVCSRKQVIFEIGKEANLEELVEKIKNKYQLNSLDLHSSDSVLFMSVSIVPEMEEVFKENLLKDLSQLNILDGDEVLVADPSLREAITLTLKFV
ncbi:hypothetical protein FO519_007739 [Halicephalobus sp. NKZ332]|nr:hypothetical protein FO519_007739 [Halicephalobus sp. NKZ332]